jgi:putative colanic acid biosynthesis UDP-glucose lipid carrier transferase
MDAVAWNRREADQFRRLGRTQQYGAVFTRLVFLADSCVLYGTLFLAQRWLGIGWSQRYVTLALLGIVIFGCVVSLRQLYRSWRLQKLRAELGETALMLALTFAALAMVLFATTRWIEGAANLRMLGLWLLLALPGMAAVRLAMRALLGVYRIGPADHRRVAILGLTETGNSLARVFAEHPWMGIDVVGFFDGGDAAGGAPVPIQAAGGLADLLALAQAGEISAVYIALPMHGETQLGDLVDRFADTTVSIYYCPPLRSLDLLNAHWDDVFGHPVISLVASPFEGAGRYIKRAEDLVLALLILPLIAIPMLLIAIAVKLSSPGPVFYLQSRHGLGGKPFKVRKFRTMYTVDRDHEFVQARRHDARITPLGRFLRRASLDELPQFYNVLLGEMSVVGPRPAPVKYNEDHRRIIHRYMVRHKVKPGITGLAQVSGSRGETPSVAKTEERTMLDLEYINTWSLWLDLRILVKTFAVTVHEFNA